MRSGTLAVRFWRDEDGTNLLEFTVVIPMLMMIAFCTVDFSLVLFDWAQANKAVQRGARVAVVAMPVAQGLNDLTYVEASLGKRCFDIDTGAPTGECDSIETVCTATADDGECDGWGTFSNAAFEPILQAMQDIAPSLRLEREHVQITYRTTSLGFVGRPGGLPMEVTVQLRCMTHEIYFLTAFAGWSFPGQGCWPAGFPIPPYATTLTSEALGS